MIKIASTLLKYTLTPVTTPMTKAPTNERVMMALLRVPEQSATATFLLLGALLHKWPLPCSILTRVVMNARDERSNATARIRVSVVAG